MRTAAVAFILSTLCAAGLTPLVRRLASQLGLLDHAISARKIHGHAVPRLGGIAIVIAFYAPLLGLMFAQTAVGGLLQHEQHFALGLFVGGLIVAGLGVYDDLRGAGARKKFAIQFVVAGIVYFLGFRIDMIGNPFGEPIALGWVAVPFTLIWVVGVINAMNLIDGLDGLAGGVALVAVATLFLVSVHRAQPLMILFSAALAGSILGFLFYNFNPASIFMGDTGSMFLGFVLATTTMRTGQKSSTTAAVLIPIIILGLPILDTLLALTRRAVRGRPLFRADKEHIHHRLLGLGLSHRQAVLVLYGLCMLLGGMALLLTYITSATVTVILLAVLAGSVFIFLRQLGYIRFEVNHLLSDQRRRNRALRVAVRPYVERLRRSTGTEEIWEIVREACPVFQAAAVRLELLGTGRAGQAPTTVFASGASLTADSTEENTPTPSTEFRARFGLLGTRREEGSLQLAWFDARTSLDRDLEIAIELFCDSVVDAHERVRSRSRMTERPSHDPPRAGIGPTLN